MKKWRWLGVALLALSGLGMNMRAKADDAPAAKGDLHKYQLSFVVKEVDGDGKTTNSRIYKAPIETQHGSASIRTGTKIPVLSSMKEGAAEYQYIDVGVDIDSEGALEVPEGLKLRITAQLSSAAGTQSAAGQPIIRQNRWQAETVLQEGKPTLLFSSDNLDNKGRTEVEVTATRIP